MSLLDVLKTLPNRVPAPSEAEGTVRDLPDPEQVTISLEYPGRGLLEPLVKAGDVVARHQVIGRSEQGHCVHASIGGRVLEIGRIWTAGGYQVPAATIEAADIPDLTPDEALARCELDRASATRVQLLNAAGVISPWSVPAFREQKDEPAALPEIRHVIVLGHDDEPTQHVQELLLEDRAPDLRKSLRLLRDLAPRATVTLTVPGSRLVRARESFGDAVKIFGVAKDYRHRLERALVRRLTRVDLPAAVPYRDRGLAVITVEHALAAQDAMEGRPFVRKTVTVSGDALPRPVTVRAPLGTAVGDILAACGVEARDAARILAGGPMRGMALFSSDTPLDKFQRGLHLIAPGELPAKVNLSCVNCGRCVRACPSHLQVHLIARYVEFDYPGDAVALHPEACLECGLCAFVCPARRPLVQLVRLARARARRAS